MNEFTAQRQETAFIDIDTTLKPSVYKKLVWGFCLLIFVFMLILMSLSMGYKILVAIAALVGLWFGQIYSYHLLVISSFAAKSPRHTAALTLNRFDFLSWQIQWVRGVVKVPWHSQQDVWQATLLDMTDMGCMVILKLYLIESPQTNISVTIWQDQVESDTWRQIKVLAKTLV